MEGRKEDEVRWEEAAPPVHLHFLQATFFSVLFF